MLLLRLELLLLGVVLLQLLRVLVVLLTWLLTLPWKLLLIVWLLLLLRLRLATPAAPTPSAISISGSSAPPSPTTASEFETSGQGMASVGPVEMLVELLRVYEATLQATEAELILNGKTFLHKIVIRGKVSKNAVTYFLIFHFSNVVSLVPSL